MLFITACHEYILTVTYGFGSFLGCQIGICVLCILVIYIVYQWKDSVPGVHSVEPPRGHRHENDIPFELHVFWPSDTESRIKLTFF